VRDQQRLLNPHVRQVRPCRRDEDQFETCPGTIALLDPPGVVSPSRSTRQMTRLAGPRWDRLSTSFRPRFDFALDFQRYQCVTGEPDAWRLRALDLAARQSGVLAQNREPRQHSAMRGRGFARSSPVLMPAIIWSLHLRRSNFCQFLTSLAALCGTARSSQWQSPYRRQEHSDARRPSPPDSTMVTPRYPTGCPFAGSAKRHQDLRLPRQPSRSSTIRHGCSGRSPWCMLSYPEFASDDRGRAAAATTCGRILSRGSLTQSGAGMR
jgi:hypothetical protein